MSKGKGASRKNTADMRPSAPTKTTKSVPPPPPGSRHHTSTSMTYVSSLSLTSSPVSVNGINMVSPDKTMFSPRTMRESPSPDLPSSTHQSHTVHGDDKNRVVCCLDEDLASTKETTVPFQQSAALGSSLTSSCLDVETPQNTKCPNKKRGQVESDYVCLMLLKTVMVQDSSVTVMLKEQGTKTSKKDLFKEIVKVCHQISVFFMKKIKANFAKSKQGEDRGQWHYSCRRARHQSKKQSRRREPLMCSLLYICNI